MSLGMWQKINFLCCILTKMIRAASDCLMTGVISYCQWSYDWCAWIILTHLAVRGALFLHDVYNNFQSISSRSIWNLLLTDMFWQLHLVKSISTKSCFFSVSINQCTVIWRLSIMTGVVVAAMLLNCALQTLVKWFYHPILIRGAERRLKLL